ncbi:MAG: type IV pilus assembly protein PilM [Candidatus Sungbacteria bacterium]|nr:type IV pilus assembly protein PilM [Candidatus Sungbacteria bacterium]
MGKAIWYNMMVMKERLTQWIEKFVRLPVAGLDVSDRSLKYAQFTMRPKSAGGGLMLVCIGEEEIPEGIIVSGSVEKPEAFSAVLKRVAAKAGRAFRASGLVVSLPEEKSFVRVFQTPKVGLREMAGAIRWKIEEEIPLPSEDVVYDYEPIRPPDGEVDHHDAVVTAFPKGVVLSYVEAIKSAGLVPMALELESQAIVRAVASGLAPGSAVIVIDMGRNRTSVILLAGGAIVFTATVPVGGYTLDAAIAVALGIPEREAAELKNKTGFAKDAYDGKIFSAMAPSADIIAEELRRVIAYYQDRITHMHGASRVVDKILLSGGGANVPGIDTYFASAVRVPVEFADPFAGIGNVMGDPVPPMSRASALAFTAAIGLALRGMQPERA